MFGRLAMGFANVRAATRVLMLVLVQAVPRDWLVAGEAPLVVDKATTRYGRVSFSLAVSSPAADSGGAYTVTANVTLPPSVGQAGAAQPAGG